MITHQQYPSILILGRPNVGKSTFVNRLIGSRLSITLDEPGVTRDLLSYLITIEDKTVELIDSGGVDRYRVSDPFSSIIEERVMKAAQQVSQIIFIVDATTGITQPDTKIAAQLRPLSGKVTLVANKADLTHLDYLSDYYRLGLGDPHPVSAKTGHGLQEVLRLVTHTFSAAPSDGDPLSIAIVGKPNVGKSSILNALLGRDYAITSDIAGTTRDPVHAYIRIHNTPIQLIDTAGLKKAKQVNDGIDYYASRRSMACMSASFATLLVIDATLGLLDQDKRLIRHVIEAGRRLILVVNKLDLSTMTKPELTTYLTDTIPELAFYPILMMSATNRQFMGPLSEAIDSLVEHRHFRVPTSELNQLFDAMIRRFPPRSKSGVLLKVYYATQVGSDPPEFLIFVNHPDAVSSDFTRFIEKRLRLAYPPLHGVPVIIRFKPRRAQRD